MNRTKLITFILVLFSLFTLKLTAQNVSIGGNNFYVDGQEIFFNGINTAWQPQSDWSLNYLGRNFDYNWWNNEFQRYVENHINLARVWVHCSGNYSPSLNGDGLVTGASNQFWQDMDNLVAISREKQVYIMPTLWSFDMVKSDSGWSWYYDQYRQIINDQNKTQWYIEYFLIPFLQRYENEPYVMGYDICNEPEHMWRDANCGNLNRDNVVRFVAMVAAAINQYSSKPVTLGSMWIIFNSNKFSGTWETYIGNNWSNSSLQAQYNNGNAYLDFWSPHWYAWQSTGGPFDTSIGQWLDDGNRPALIGETYGGDVYDGVPSNNCCWNMSMADYYIQSYQNGYAGVCGWKNPHEDDGEGTFAGIAGGTNSFYNSYPKLVYPNTGGSQTYHTVPGAFGAESYSNMSGIQTEACSDDGGGLNVAYIDDNDWLTYNIEVANAGIYTVSYRVASPNSTGEIRMEEAGGGSSFGNISVPNTGGWQVWTTISHNINLSHGQQQLGLVALTGGFNINWISIDQTTASTSYIQAENYNNMSGVDTETCSEGGLNVGWIDAGDWMTFNDIQVPTSGSYIIDYRVASENGGGSLQLEQAGGENIYGSVDIPATGGWQNWSIVSHTVNLNAGTQNFGIKALAGGWNINWWALSTGNKSALAENEEMISGHEYFKLYPNPATNFINIELPVGYPKAMLDIYSITGQKIMQKEIEGSTIFSVASMAKGEYVFRLTAQNQIYNTKIRIDK